MSNKQVSYITGSTVLQNDTMRTILQKMIKWTFKQLLCNMVSPDVP